MRTNANDEYAINIIRGLALDMIANANSGHPGIALGAAPMIYTVYRYFLNYNPSKVDWVNRDRFIMSAGHGSALLYAMLYFSGYNIDMEDLKQFRKYGSITPGHPEYGVTPGVEATTGPLGQGFAMGVGVAIAEQILKRSFGDIIDHFTYALVSDGELMEGVTSEAASLAGKMKLGKLIYLYDSNGISLDGQLSLSFTEDVRKRFDAYNWHTQLVDDGNSVYQIKNAIENAKNEEHKPSIIIVKTHIGFASPFQDTNKVHGTPIIEDDLYQTKIKLGLNPQKKFYADQTVLDLFAERVKNNISIYDLWKDKIELYEINEPEKYDLFNKFINKHINEELLKNIVKMEFDKKPVSTRVVSQKIMNKISDYMFEFIGGSADLSSSTKTFLYNRDEVGYGEKFEKNIFYGVREHAMGAITNGLALHGGLIPYASTFLVFSDYMRPAIREAAIMNLHSIFVFSHDSIVVGEDGPTHQPIEQLPGLRLIPNLMVYRPADSQETAAVWYYAITNKKPSVIILTRQKINQLGLDYKYQFSGVGRGAYVVKDFLYNDKPKVILISTGSEVSLSLKSVLGMDNVDARVVSMPCVELFLNQPEEYIKKILPENVKKRLFVEAASSSFQDEILLGRAGHLGVKRFGKSAKGSLLYEKYGFNVKNIQKIISDLLI